MEKNKSKSSLPIVINELQSNKILKSNSTIKRKITIEKYQSTLSYFEGFHRPISKIINLND